MAGAVCTFLGLSAMDNRLSDFRSVARSRSAGARECVLRLDFERFAAVTSRILSDRRLRRGIWFSSSDVVVRRIALRCGEWLRTAAAAVMLVVSVTFPEVVARVGACVSRVAIVIVYIAVVGWRSAGLVAEWFVGFRWVFCYDDWCCSFAEYKQIWANTIDPYVEVRYDSGGRWIHSWPFANGQLCIAYICDGVPCFVAYLHSPTQGRLCCIQLWKLVLLDLPSCCFRFCMTICSECVKQRNAKVNVWGFLRFEIHAPRAFSSRSAWWITRRQYRTVECCAILYFGISRARDLYLWPCFELPTLSYSLVTVQYIKPNIQISI